MVCNGVTARKDTDFHGSQDPIDIAKAEGLSSFDACCTLCLSLKPCVAFTYDMVRGGVCYMKNGTGSLIIVRSARETILWTSEVRIRVELRVCTLGQKSLS